MRLLPRRRPTREPLIRPEDILLSKRITWRIDEPFTIFECDEFLRPDIYDELVAGFPIDVLRSRMDGHALRSRVDERLHPEIFGAVLKSSNAWFDFHAAVTSRAFVTDFRRLFRRQIIGRSRRPFRVIRSVVEQLGGGWCDVKMDFVLARAGYHLSPHTDSPAKLVALMLYLPAAGRTCDARVAATRFWEVSTQGWDGAHESGLLGGQSLPRVLTTEDHDQEQTTQFLEAARHVRDVEYRDNRLAGFVKSRKSWHSVDMRSAIANSERCTVLINVELRSAHSEFFGAVRRVGRMLVPGRWRRVRPEGVAAGG